MIEYIKPLDTTTQMYRDAIEAHKASRNYNDKLSFLASRVIVDPCDHAMVDQWERDIAAQAHADDL